MTEQPAYKKICPECHLTFFANTPTAIYCPTCRVRRYRLKNPQHDVVCKYRNCKNVFTSSYNRSAYCCDSHRVLEYLARLEEEKLKAVTQCQTNPSP